VRGGKARPEARQPGVGDEATQNRKSSAVRPAEGDAELEELSRAPRPTFNYKPA
jgi:hypothetical protein